MDWTLLFQGILAVSAFFGILLGIIKLSLKPLDQDLKGIEEKLKYVNYIHDFLIKNFPKYNPYTQNFSPKKLTESGHEILEKIKVADYLKSNCKELLEDTELQKKTDLEIYMACIEWAKQHGKEKAMEIKLNTQLLEEQAQELLALAIMERIKAKNLT